MSKTNFGILNSIQYITINVSNIRGFGGFNSPYLIIPITLNLAEAKNHNEVVHPFEILNIKSELKLAGRDYIISESFTILNGDIDRSTERTYEIKFPLSEKSIYILEKNRPDNLSLYISFELQIGIYDKFTIENHRGEQSEKKFITRFDRPFTQTSFIIEQSFWINKILPSIGHNSYKLVEIPKTNQVIPEEYKKSILEFEQAQKYFTNGDYDKVVAHCRAALDPFNGPKNLPKLKEFVKSKSEFEWATSVLEATEFWLEKVIKSTSSFTSKTHHTPSVGHFGRTDAEIVLLITTGIIAYIGKLEYKPE